MADRIVVFRDGRIEQAGTPLEVYRRPANLFVAGFIGSPRMNLLTRSRALAHDAATIGIRPEHLKIAADGAFAGVVQTVEHLGNEALVHARLDDGAVLTARCPEDVVTGPGEAIAFSADRAFVHRFDGDGRALRTDW